MGTAIPADDEAFQLILLRDTWSRLGMGYHWDTAMAILMQADLRRHLFVAGLREIERYDWDRQIITLTGDATEALGRAAGHARHDKGPAALMSLGESLGWGNALERALYTHAFVVRAEGATVYGGICLDAVSQMAIDYPVLRVTAAGGKAALAVLPVHVPFVMADPASSSGKSELSVAAEAGEDVRQLDQHDGFMSSWIMGIATGPTARRFRGLIRDARIEAALRAAGKLGEQTDPAG